MPRTPDPMRKASRKHRNEQKLEVRGLPTPITRASSAFVRLWVSLTAVEHREQAAAAAESMTTAATARQFGVHRSTIYRWKKTKPQVQAANPSKFYAARDPGKTRYVYFPEMETMCVGHLSNPGQT